MLSLGIRVAGWLERYTRDGELGVCTIRVVAGASTVEVLEVVSDAVLATTVEDMAGAVGAAATEAMLLSL